MARTTRFVFVDKALDATALDADSITGALDELARLLGHSESGALWRFGSGPPAHYAVQSGQVVFGYAPYVQASERAAARRAATGAL